jgi:hypothetical protein
MATPILALALGACGRDASRGIAGEWTVELTVGRAGTPPSPEPGQRLRGILVIDPRIPDAYERRSDRPEWAGFTMGRNYMRGPFSSDSTAVPYDYKPGLPEDLFEEAIARMDSAGGFQAVLMPGATHIGTSLRGTMSEDRITGTWKSDAYVGEVGVRGTFVMRRGRRTAATDSAIHRARRGQQEWERDSR